VKILWLSHLVPYPPKGGVLQRSYNLLRELAKYHEVDLLAFNQKPMMLTHYPDIETGIADAKAHLGEFCGRIEVLQLPVDKSRYGRHLIALKSLFTRPYNINWLVSDEYADRLRAWLSESRYDLVHFDTISFAPYKPLLPPGTPTALDHHNIESPMLIRRAEMETNLPKKFYFWQEGVRLRHYEATHCPQFSTNITCSDLDTERLLEISPGCDAQTIPNGVDIDYFKPGEEGDELRLIFVGRLNWYPNAQAVTWIAEVLWPLLKKRWPEIRFDIIGANPPAAAKELAARDPHFIVHGFVDEMRTYLARATVYVCPITDGGGTKLKMLDALAMGKAIVADPIACEGINITDGVNVLLASEPAAYVERIAEFVGSAEKRAAFGRAARKLIEDEYSYAAIGRTLAALYENRANKR
jgi:glycosyltransferase involved in cell wall biosynthesis